MQDRTCYIRDISQAYCQSDGFLTRDVFLEAPAEMKLPQNMLLKTVKPLYGIPESGHFWYETYHRHHTVRLGMISAEQDPCFLYSKSMNSNLPDIFVLQVDDYLCTGDGYFCMMN